MFTINTSITDLKVKERNIYKMLYSMNSPQVATPDLSVEEARCYILLFSEGPNLSAYIGLYLPRLDRKIFYVYTSNPFPFEAAAEVQAEAIGFAEDMGFLLDEIGISGMQADDRNQWIEEQFIFGYRRPELPEEEQAAIAGEAEKAVTAEKEEAAAAPQTLEPAAVPVETVQPAPMPAQAPAVAVTQASPVMPQPEPFQQPQMQPQVPPQPYPQYQQPAPQYPPQQQMPQTYPQQPLPQQPYSQPQQYQQPYGQPQQPYPQPIQYPPYQQPVPPQGQPVAPPYPSVPLQRQPDQEKPAAPPRRDQPVAPPKPLPKKKAQKVRQPELKGAFEEEAPIELELEPAPKRQQNVYEEALREGVVKPPKTKAARAVPSAAGVVSRDKEALARLLASF